jgi:hypothetical protein
LSRAGRPQSAIVDRDSSIVNQNVNATNGFRAGPAGFLSAFALIRKDLSGSVTANAER